MKNPLRFNFPEDEKPELDTLKYKLCKMLGLDPNEVEMGVVDLRQAGPGKIIKVPETTCQNCNNKFNKLGLLRQDLNNEIPCIGDYSICGQCGHAGEVIEINEKLYLRPVTESEFFNSCGCPSCHAMVGRASRVLQVHIGHGVVFKPE